MLRDVSKITDSEFEPTLAGSKATGTVWGKSKGGGEGGGGDWGGLGDLGAVLVQVKVFCSNEEEGWRLEI